MNLSLLPIYGATFLSRRLLDAARSLENTAQRIENIRSLTKGQRDVLARNIVFADRHKGQTAFVIVNGPSLATQDLSRITDHLSFVVSGFWKHELVKTWQPTYYSLLDANFFTDTQATKDFYAQLNQRIHSSTFFIPLYRGFDFIRAHNLLPFDRTFYIAAIGTSVPSNDLTSIVQSFAGVSAFSLAQAVFMGCNPIYLLGFDHDYMVQRDVAQHFYTGGTIQGHHHNSIPLSERVPYDVEMRANLSLWNNYRTLAKIAEQKGIKIFNATRGGYLDVFPRIDYESIDANVAKN